MQNILSGHHPELVPGSHAVLREDCCGFLMELPHGGSAKAVTSYTSSAWGGEGAQGCDGRRNKNVSAAPD
jgi:hypothetical protein